MRVLFFDSNVWDTVLLDGELLKTLGSATSTHRILIASSHIQIDESSKMEPNKLKKIKALRKDFDELSVPTAGLILGVSRLGEASLPSEQVVKQFEDFLRGTKRKNHIADALIALTGGTFGFVVVTNDKRLRTRALRVGVTCWSLEELRNSLDLEGQIEPRTDSRKRRGPTSG